MTLFNKKLEITLGNGSKNRKLGYFDFEILPVFTVSATLNTFQILFSWLIYHVHIIYEKGETY